MKSCLTCLRGPDRSATNVACHYCNDDLDQFVPGLYSSTEFDEERMDRIGQNGNTAEHYDRIRTLDDLAGIDARDCYGDYNEGSAMIALRDCLTCDNLRSCQNAGLSTPVPDVNSAEDNSAPGFLYRAAEIMENRGKQYDQEGGERSMGKTVAAFNTITGRDLTEAEGWLLLQVLKDVRQWQRPAYHADSAEDCVAYAALKAEALARVEYK